MSFLPQTVRDAWTTATGTAADYWSKRPPWLGGPTLASEPAPANTSSTPAVGARRRKTYRKKAKKSKRRRTGRMSTGFPRLFRM